MKSLLFLAASAFLLLSGCSSDTQVSANFTQPQAVRSGDPVQFNGQQIGEVSSIKDEGEGVKLVLDLDPEMLTGLDDASVAMVIAQPQRRVELYSTGTGQALESGAQIRGMNNALDLASWTASNAMGSFQEMINTAAKELNTFMNSQDWEALNKQFSDTLSDLSAQSSGALDEVGSELEEFIKNMQAQSSESMKQADEFAQQLNEELQKFQSQGNEDIARALQEMLDSFNAMLDPNVVAPLDPEKGEAL